jgi:hypothetical protein
MRDERGPIRSRRPSSARKPQQQPSRRCWVPQAIERREVATQMLVIPSEVRLFVASNEKCGEVKSGNNQRNTDKGRRGNDDDPRCIPMTKHDEAQTSG